MQQNKIMEMHTWSKMNINGKPMLFMITINKTIDNVQSTIEFDNNIVFVVFQFANCYWGEFMPI